MTKERYEARIQFTVEGGQEVPADLYKVGWVPVTAIPGAEMESVTITPLGKVPQSIIGWEKLVSQIKEMGLYNEQESSPHLIKIGGMEDEIRILTHKEIVKMLTEWGVYSDLAPHMEVDDRLWVYCARWHKSSVMTEEDAEQLDNMVIDFVKENNYHLMTELSDGPINIDNTINVEGSHGAISNINHVYASKGGWY